jgi:jumonji domain-containing protein 7
VNLWIGSSRSVTSFHHDPYVPLLVTIADIRFENIYHVLSGSKTFSLVSPIEGLFFDRMPSSFF